MSSSIDRKAIRALEKDAANAEKARGEIVAQNMSTIAGRAYILDQLEKSHIFATSMDADPLRIAFNEGERNIGLQLLNDIMRYCPDQYVTMMHERNARDAARQRIADDQLARSQDGVGGVEEPDEPDSTIGSDVYGGNGARPSH